MALYRVVRNLAVKHRIIPRGTLSLLNELAANAKEILEQKGAIALAATPPLTVLPGWKARSQRLLKANIITIADFLEIDDKDLARIMRVGEQKIRLWQIDLLAQLSGELKGR